MFPRLAIPTLGRSDTISGMTLAYLKKEGYPSDKIYLFVVPEEEVLYRTSVPKDLYGHLVVGVRGLCNQRNFITNFFEEGELICSMDDDVRQLKSTKSFLEIVKMGMDALGTEGGLFGVLPNDDTRRMKDATTTHLTHILGSFFVYKNHKDIRMTLSEKEDMERSILYFKRYGKVFRYQGAGVSTKYRGGTGGLQTPGRSERISLEIAYLLQMYPGYCRSVLKKELDILLDWRAKQ